VLKGLLRVQRREASLSLAGLSIYLDSESVEQLALDQVSTAANGWDGTTSASGGESIFVNHL